MKSSVFKDIKYNIPMCPIKNTQSKYVKLTHNSTPDGKRKVCDMILLIGGPVDWEGRPVDWRAWETWIGEIKYRERGCGIKVDWVMLRELRLESEKE